MLWIDPRHQRRHHITRHVFMQPVQDKMIVMCLFEYGNLLDTHKREIILLATEPGRERQSAADTLAHQLQNVRLLEMREPLEDLEKTMG